MAEEAGADHVIVDAEGRFAEEALRLTRGEGVHVVSMTTRAPRPSKDRSICCAGRAPSAGMGGFSVDRGRSTS
jgi:hypothetical protein